MSGRQNLFFMQEYLKCTPNLSCRGFLPFSESIKPSESCLLESLNQLGLSLEFNLDNTEIDLRKYEFQMCVGTGLQWI